MTKYIDMENENSYNENKLKQAANIIKNGGIVVFPTETVYGIGTNGLDSKAVEKLYNIKNRNKQNPVNLLVSSIEMVKQITKDISELEYKLMESFFPGPLTIILKRKNIIPDIVTAGSDTVGIRMPSDKIAKKLVEFANVPIAAPSANISGKPSGTNLDSVMSDFDNNVDCIINGGESSIGIESTIVKVIDDTPHILRPGFITLEQIKSICKDVVLEDNSNSSHLPSSNLKHYQLNSKCILVYSNNNEKVIDTIDAICDDYITPLVVCYDETIDLYRCKAKVSLGSKYDLNQISKNMFSTLRKADLSMSDKLAHDIIIIEGIKKEDLGLTIMNRLLNVCNNNIIEID